MKKGIGKRQRNGVSDGTKKQTVMPIRKNYGQVTIFLSVSNAK